MCDDASFETLLDDGLVDLAHQSIGHPLLQRLREVLVGIELDAQVFLHFLDLTDAFHAGLVQIRRDLPYLADLHLEALVFSLLPLVGLVYYVVQDGDLLLQVTLNVGALRLRHVLNSVLLALELPDLLSCIGHFSLQLHDVVLKVVDGRLEAEGLLRAQGRV